MYATSPASPSPASTQTSSGVKQQSAAIPAPIPPKKTSRLLAQRLSGGLSVEAGRGRVDEVSNKLVGIWDIEGIRERSTQGSSSGAIFAR